MSDSGRADALLADMPKDGRGRLKVFLGAAPGVGKTYAMLQAAHTQLRQGVTVLAGVVETHGRAETEALLGGLVQQPLVRCAIPAPSGAPPARSRSSEAACGRDALRLPPGVRRKTG